MHGTGVIGGHLLLFWRFCNRFSVGYSRKPSRITWIRTNLVSRGLEAPAEARDIARVRDDGMEVHTA